MTDTIEDRPRFANLTEEQQSLLKGWRANLSTGKVGLWVYGKRGFGTSYIAWLAMNMIYREHKTWTHNKYSARQVIEAKRELWTLERNPNRYDSEELTVDYYSLVDDFKRLGEWDYLWIDNLHDTLDIEFWMRHVQHDIDERVEDRRPTVIANNLAPNHPSVEFMQRVIEQRYVVIHAGR